MTGRHALFTAAITAILLISASAYAGGGMGGGPGGGMGMMGGQGHGMMGSGGNGMMGSDPSYSNPWASSQSGKSVTDQERRLEREQLREEIRKKRLELSELYNSDKPDQTLIDQRIAELHALEAEYDRSLFSVE